MPPHAEKTTPIKQSACLILISSFFVAFFIQLFLQYQQNLLDNNLYKALELPWIISGILQSETTNGVIVNGVYDKNKKTVEINNIQMPGLNSKLANLTEFYTDTTYIVPENINPQ